MNVHTIVHSLVYLVYLVSKTTLMDVTSTGGDSVVERPAGGPRLSFVVTETNLPHPLAQSPAGATQRSQVTHQVNTFGSSFTL